MPLVLYKTGKIQTQSRKQKSPLLQLSGDPSCPQSGVFPSSLAWYPAYYSISWCIHWTNILWIVSHVGKFFFYPRRSDRTEILSKRTLVQSLATPLSSCKALGKLPNSSLLSSHLKRGSKEHLPHVFVMRVEPWGPAHVKRTSKFWHYNKSELIHIIFDCMVFPRIEVASLWNEFPIFLDTRVISVFHCSAVLQRWSFVDTTLPASLVIFMEVGGKSYGLPLRAAQDLPLGAFYGWFSHPCPSGFSFTQAWEAASGLPGATLAPPPG